MALVNKTFSDIITFTRASTATFFNSAGVLTSAATNAPRFDYNPSTLAAQGLLIEESRANLFTYSAQFDDAAWLKGGTISANEIVAPDGTLSADLLTAANTTFSGSLRQTPTVTSATAYTISAFVKKNNWRYVGLRFSTSTFGATEQVPFYDFDTDAVSNGGVTGATITRTLVGNGWVRLAMTFTSTSTSGTSQIWITDSNGATAPAKAGTESVYVWGAQLEAGAFPTSYIPTTTTALTRAQDRAVVNTISPWYNSVAGTIYAEFSLTLPASGGNQFFTQTSDNSYNNRIVNNISSTAFPNTSTVSGGTSDGFASTAGAVTANTTVKVAAAYASNDLAISLNGGTVATDNTVTIPSGLTRFDLGSDHLGFNNVKAGYLRRITYYPTRLSNAQLQAITA